MNTRGFSAYNLERGTLLNSRLTLADSGNQPLKLLDIVVSGMGMDPAAGLWLSPLHACPAVPRVFPFDLIYLDKECRVLDTAEMGPGIDFPAFHPDVASSLVLPCDTLRRTQTAPGDRLIVCLSNDLESQLAASSLPTSNLTELTAESAGSLSAHNQTNRSGLIEGASERPSSRSPVTAFEQSILTAVAKVAETRSSLEPKAVAIPSASNNEAVLDPFRKSQPPIVEHHIDPEDLFSIWVPSSPPPPRKAQALPPEPPFQAKSEESIQNNTAKVIKQSSSDPASNPEAESPAPSLVASPITAPAKTKKIPASPVSRSSASSDPPAKTDEQTDPGPVSSKPPVTTFTTVPYGMWRVSAPTALASMAGAKSPEPASPVTDSSRNAVVRQSSPAAEKTPAAATRTSASSAETPSRAQPKNAQPVTSRAEEIAVSTKPSHRDAVDSDAHKPGDFVASLQEKFRRAQRSSPVAPSAESMAPEPTPSTSITYPAEETAQPVRQQLPDLAPMVADPTPAAAGNMASAPAPKSAAAPVVPAKPKADPPTEGLRSKFKKWLNPISTASDRRRAARRYVPGMVAHYFTGGAPKPKDVADISMSGLYLLTDDRWMPGTMIQMTLQKPCADGEKKQSINVLSRIVRRGSDGVAAEFVMPDGLSRISHDIQPSQATDKFALARFL